MPNPLVISVDPNGVAEFTRNPQLETFFGGRGEMQRVTEVFKNGPRDYRIKWLMGPNAGRTHTYGMSIAYGVVSTVPAVELEMSFATYETAVGHEVQVLNAMRKAGIRFSSE